MHLEKELDDVFTKGLIMRFTVWQMLATGICLTCAEALHAGGVADFSNIDFSLRFPSALTRFSSYADVAGFGGASAGSRYSTSINPAATDWMASRETPYSLSAQMSKIRFQAGPTLTNTALAGSVSSSQWGSFQPAFAQVRNDGNLEGDFLLIRGDYAQMQWGKRIREDWAVGANINYSAFNTKSGQGSVLVAESNSETYDARFGVLGTVSRKLMAGLVFDYSIGRGKSDTYDTNCTCFLPGRDTTKGILFRPGISYEYADQSSIFLDYLHSRYNNSTGSISSNLVFLGVEHRFIQGVFGRAGLAYDFRGITSQTLGLGLNPTKALSIDIAYQNDMFPELRPEFGKSRLANVSASLAF